ncbi:MAG: ribonuclease III family protein [Methanomassiliicoccales archaeon]|nr:MAG: ribonuclease III family protein [Methanomassiliicoccales archaeon]
MEIKMMRLEELLGYKFSNISLLELALRHRSVGSENNERLEFLGDSVLSFIVSRKLFLEGLKDDEATLTRKRSVLTDRTTLRKVAERLGLKELVMVGDSLQGRTSQKMLADVVEAIIGAVYLDGGVEGAERVISKILFEGDLAAEALERQDWISMVKEWSDQQRVQYRYVTFEEDAEDGKYFQAWLTVGDLTETGTGGTKKEAMASAAKKMMAKLSP